MNKFRQEIEITKTKRCDQKLSREKKKRKTGTLHGKYRTSDELLVDNSRGLGTALQQIPLDLFFMSYSTRKPNFFLAF